MQTRKENRCEEEGELLKGLYSGFTFSHFWRNSSRCMSEETRSLSFICASGPLVVSSSVSWNSVDLINFIFWNVE